MLSISYMGFSNMPFRNICPYCWSQVSVCLLNVIISGNFALIWIIRTTIILPFFIWQQHLYEHNLARKCLAFFECKYVLETIRMRLLKEVTLSVLQKMWNVKPINQIISDIHGRGGNKFHFNLSLKLIGVKMKPYYHSHVVKTCLLTSIIISKA